MYSLVLSLSALSSQFTLWAISSPCSPSHSIVELYLLQFSLGVPQLIQTGSLVIMLPTRLQSLHLDVLASPSSLLRLLTPQANLEIFKDQTLTTMRREQPGKEIVLITVENGKQSEMSRPVLTILKYYKLQLQTARAMPAIQVLNDIIQTLTSTRMRVDTLYIILVGFHSGPRARNM